MVPRGLLRLGFTAEQQLTVVALLSYCRFPRLTCFPSYDTLREAFGLPPTTRDKVAKRRTDDLVPHGLKITEARNSSGHRARTYDLTVIWNKAVAATPKTEEQDVALGTPVEANDDGTGPSGTGRILRGAELELAREKFDAVFQDLCIDKGVERVPFDPADLFRPDHADPPETQAQIHFENFIKERQRSSAPPPQQPEVEDEFLADLRREREARLKEARALLQVRRATGEALLNDAGLDPEAAFKDAFEWVSRQPHVPDARRAERVVGMTLRTLELQKNGQGRDASVAPTEGEPKLPPS